MTGYSILEGVNCIFFPGGTRSRSGQTEDKLKLGLISSVIEAQRLHLENKEDKKIFVVPLNIGYHFVLEASQLIDQHLQSVGREKYTRSKKTGPNFGDIWRFIKDLYSKDSEVYMSFGDPMDVFGNKVDDHGVSFDKFGHQVNIEDYFTFDGKLSGNSQRESVYAKMLGECVVSSYRKFNTILSSNVVSFVAFHLIYAEFEEMGLINLINQKNQKYKIEYNVFAEKVGQVINIIKEMSAQGDVTLSDENWDDTQEIISEGLRKLGIYHAVRVLEKKEDDKIVCADLKLLYFYHNRLINYDLETAMGWSKV